MKISFLPLLSSNHIRKLERKYNHTELLEKASTCLYKSLHIIDKAYLKKIIIICGPGNNGADGLFLASLLIKSQYSVSIFFPNDYASNHKDLINRLDLTAFIIKDDNFKDATLIIDGIFGSGLNRKLDNEISKLIHNINQLSAYKISIDVPTGLNSEGKQNTSNVLERHNIVKSNLTVSFISLKKGLFTAQGRDHWSVIHHYKLIDEKLTSTTYLFSLDGFITSGIIFDPKSLEDIIQKDYLKDISATHNAKKTDARGLIIGGNNEYLGALLLASEAALKTGVRYLTTLSSKNNSKLIPIKIPEIISHTYNEINNLTLKFNSLLIGPGLGRKKLSEEIFSNFLSLLKNNNNLPVIVDADGINLLSQNCFFYDKWILTPHEGEAAQLLDTSVDYIIEDRYRATDEIYEKYGGIVALKGAGTIINNGTNTYLCSHGNYGMAMAGMGDCLSGILLGLHCMKLTQIDATLISIGIHSQAADLLADEFGLIGILPTNVINKVSTILNQLK